MSDLGPRSMNDTDLWYSYRFIYSFSWLHLPTLTSYNTIVSEKSVVLPFCPYKNCKGPNLTSPQNRSRSTQDCHLSKLGSTQALDDAFQGHQPFGSKEEDILRFLPYMYIGMAAILVMWPGLFEQTIVAPSHRSSIWNLTLIGPVVSEEKMFQECGWQRLEDDDGGLPIL